MKIKSLGKFVMLCMGALLLLAEASFASAGVQTRISVDSAMSVQVNGVAREIWVNYIIENLFKNAEWMKFAYNDDMYVLAGKVVHIPQSGAKPTIVKNRAAGMATVVTRTDTDITYALDTFTSDPTLITKVEEIEASYDKIANVLGDHMQTLRETVGDNLLYNWLLNGVASGAIRRTSGGNVTALAPGATSTRKAFVKEDLKAAQLIMNKQNVLKENRYALLPSEWVDILNADADLIKRDAQYGGELDLANGKVSKLYGFTIIDRSDVAVFDNTGTPVVKAPGAATATSDNYAGLCWQQNAVSRALGDVDFFFKEKDPQGYGDIYSALLRMGGRARRTDGKGIVPIVETA
jgi:hypothetical protein